MRSKENKPMEEAILKAAEEVFLEKGYALASTTEIAGRAGCNQTLVHYYYRTKEKLFESVFEKELMRFLSSFRDSGNQDLPFLEKMRVKIEAHFDFLLANQQLPFLILNELTTNPDRLLKLKGKYRPKVEEIFSQFSKDLKQAVRNGEVREIDTLDLLFSMASLNLSVFLLKPVVNEVLEIKDELFLNFARRRRDENIEIVLNRIKPLGER